MLTAERAKQDYKAKLITAEGYILYLLDIHRTEGWKWTFEPKQFCKEWEIPKSTFHRAVSNLKSRGLMNWEIEGKISIWKGSDIAVNDDCLTDETEVNEECLTDETAVSQVGQTRPIGETASLIDETPVPFVRQEKPKTLTRRSFQNPTYNIDKIHTKEESFQVKKDEEQENASSSLEDTPLSTEDLLKHLKWAEQGTKPTEAVIAQIREDGRYWPTLVQYARLHEWDMRSEQSYTTQVKEIIEQVKAKLKKA